MQIGKLSIFLSLSALPKSHLHDSNDRERRMEGIGDDQRDQGSHESLEDSYWVEVH